MSATAASKKVLIVDDEEPVVELISDILRKYNYEPIPATRWTDAIDVIGNQKPDLILLDLKMPTIDGPSMLEFIRGQGCSLPVIIVSGYINDQVAKDLSKFQVSGFIRKPFQVAKLKEEIDRVLGVEPELLRDTASSDGTDAPSGPAEPQGKASVDLLYSSPPSRAPEPESAPTAGSSDDEVLKALQGRASGSGSTKPPPQTPPPAGPAEKDDANILKALQKSAAPPTHPPQKEAPAPLSQAPKAQETREPVSQVSPTLPPTDTQPSVQDGMVGQPPSLEHARIQQGQGHHQGHRTRRKVRSKGAMRRNLVYMGIITLLCVGVAGFLAVMQHYASQVDFAEIKTNAEKSMSKQVKEQLMEELRKGK